MHRAALFLEEEQDKLPSCDLPATQKLYNNKDTESLQCKGYI